jgi:acetyl esterase/lipase
MNRREFARGAMGAAAALAAPAAWSRNAVAGAQNSPAQTSADQYALVDPELRPALKDFTTHTFSQDILALARQAPDVPALPAPAPPVTERHIPGPAGAPDVRIFLIDPSPDKKDKPVLVHTHGGGYITPNPAMRPFLQRIAMDCHCMVVSVDYRLAPETHFPGSLEDNYTALKWVHANADKLGVDRTRIAVGGESAGGGHAAALAIHARDKGEVPVMFQLLIYPMLDDRTGSTRPVPPSIGQFVWNAGSNRFGWTALLAVPAGSANVPVGAVPARVASVAGLPPAFIGVGSIDLFVDEDIDYAKRLIDAGVPTQLDVVPGAFHGFDLLVPDAEVSRRFVATMHAALRKAFNT